MKKYISLSLKDEPKNNLKIINLVLFNHTDIYDKMYELTRNFYKKQEIKTIYYAFRQQEQEQELVDDILYINGIERIGPGTIDKTTKAIQFVKKNYNFDYIIRTNISTLVNFKILKNLLGSIDYGSGIVYKLMWIDPPMGIIDTRYHGIDFASGTCIILSNKAVDLIDYSKINYTVADDVSLGLFFKSVGIKPVQLLEYFYDPVDNPLIKYDISKIAIYRNRCDRNENKHLDRNIDVENIKKIINDINDTNHFNENWYSEEQCKELEKLVKLTNNLEGLDGIV